MLILAMKVHRQTNPKINVVNGDIQTDIKSPDVRIETANGDMDLANWTKCLDWELTTANGTVESVFELSENGDVDVTNAWE